MRTEAVLPESELRSRVLQCIEDDRLPVLLSTTIYAGYGQGGQCDLCDQPSAADKIEYDVTVPPWRQVAALSLCLPLRLAARVRAASKKLH